MEDLFEFEDSDFSLNEKLEYLAQKGLYGSLFLTIASYIQSLKVIKVTAALSEGAFIFVFMPLLENKEFVSIRGQNKNIMSLCFLKRGLKKLRGTTKVEIDFEFAEETMQVKKEVMKF